MTEPQKKRRFFPRRGGAQQSRPHTPLLILKNDDGSKKVSGDILSSGLKNALSVGSLEGVVAREQASRAPRQHTSWRGEKHVSTPSPRPEHPGRNPKQVQGQSAPFSRNRKPKQDGAAPHPDHRPHRQDGSHPDPRKQPKQPGDVAEPKPKARKSSGGGRGKGRRPTVFVTPEALRNVDARPNKNAIPEIPKDTLRIIPLGGQEEVGRNMTVFEYGQDIVIIDMGVQFPEEDMPGIDYIVPNVDYLKGKEKNIRAVIFTHGHLDHIGAAPILLKQLHYPPVVSRDFTLALIKRKVDDQYKGDAKNLKTVRVNSVEDRMKFGAFEVRFFEVEHSIMDSMGIALVTPSGSIIHMGDWMISNEPLETRNEEISYKHLQELPRPTLLMIESLGALKKGLPPSEQEVHRNLQELIRTAPGRIIIGTFASQVRRITYLIEYAEQAGKKVALEGYSMKMNMEVAKELGYLKVKPETLITVNDIHKYHNKEIVVICTGAQGESNAALSRIVTDNHRFIKLEKSDTILFSSSVIPGNERSIQRLKDNLYRKCDHVIHSDIMEIHIGGHGTIWEIEEIIRQAKADYVMPVYANHFFIKEAAKIAYRIGYPEKNVFILDNGHILEMPKDRSIHPHILKEKADTSYVFVDGLGIGDVGHVVLRDRQMLAADGMVVITVVIDAKKKSVLGSVQITSRGFIHVKENFDLVNETKRKVQDIIKKNTSKDTSLDWDLVRNQIRDTVGQFLFTKTERRPMILPVVIEV
ncbi:MAG: RNase J family beta-CASP ribonuclease [Candidatus Moranbacteria bacterium]|nr:RNase J family beta-CASP ribonuclease [Candidatus Moranbacteria bacterium]